MSLLVPFTNAPAPTTPPLGDDPRARALLERAEAYRYTFPSGFYGFAAALTVRSEHQMWHGSVTARTPERVEVTLDDAAMSQWARCEMHALFVQCWPQRFSEHHTSCPMTLDATAHPLGPRIDLHGTPQQAHYRVRDAQITEFGRRGGTQHSITRVQESRRVHDGRYLPLHFTTAYYDATTQHLVRSETYTDRYTCHTGICLPRCRRVLVADAYALTTLELCLSQHSLLDRVKRIN